MSMLLATVALLLGMGHIDPNAMALLARMSETLRSSRSLVVTVHVERERFVHDQLINSYSVTQAALRRPNRLFTATAGDEPPFATWYDGAVFTVYNPVGDVYEQVVTSKTDDAVLSYLSARFISTSPLLPFLASNPYAVLTRGIQSARVVADVQAGDVACRQIALTGKDVDRQVWITVDDPFHLPARMAEVFKRLPGRPRIVVEFQRWDLDLSLEPGTFRFSPPEGATATNLVL